MRRREDSKEVAEAMDENEVVVRRFFDEVWSQGQFGQLQELVSPHHLHHISGETVHGPDGVLAIATWLRGSFPDLTMTIEDVINAPDTVVVRWTADATYAGADLPDANGRHVSYTGIDIVRVKGGQIVELWGNNDAQGLWEQLA
jgi:predicted ester cyclase